MATSTVRISKTSHQLLQELAKQTGQYMMDVLNNALDAYRRQIFFEKLNAGYTELRADSKAWAKMNKERNLMDNTLLDGLEPDENWTDDGRCATSRGKKP